MTREAGVQSTAAEDSCYTASQLKLNIEMHPEYPTRIVCLTEETTETLYLLGEQHRIAGISGFTVRPPQARREKPRVSAFTSANIEKILQLDPDLIIGFSDLQGDIAAELIKAGKTVWVLNHRSVEEILSMVLCLSAMVGATDRGLELVANFKHKIEQLQSSIKPPIPTVYFEEWDDPMISAIKWVSELIVIAGGTDCFTELGQMPHGKDRIIANAETVIERNPDIIVGSWCGKKFRPEKVAARPGWQKINAVRDEQLFEIKSPIILQPGPAAIMDGLDELHNIINQWKASN